LATIPATLLALVAAFGWANGGGAPAAPAESRAISWGPHLLSTRVVAEI